MTDHHYSNLLHLFPSVEYRIYLQEGRPVDHDHLPRPPSGLVASVSNFSNPSFPAGRNLEMTIKSSAESVSQLLNIEPKVSCYSRGKGKKRALEMPVTDDSNVAGPSSLPVKKGPPPTAFPSRFFLISGPSRCSQTRGNSPVSYMFRKYPSAAPRSPLRSRDAAHGRGHQSCRLLGGLWRLSRRVRTPPVSHSPPLSLRSSCAESNSLELGVPPLVPRKPSRDPAPDLVLFPKTPPLERRGSSKP